MRFTEIDVKKVTYRSIIESIGNDIILYVEEDDNAYDGHSMVILYDNEKSQYGVLLYYWGCCSGCDSLEYAIEDYESNNQSFELVRQELCDDIVWFDNKKEMKEFFVDKKAFFDYQWKINKGAFLDKEIYLNYYAKKVNNILNQFIIVLNKM